MINGKQYTSKPEIQVIFTVNTKITNKFKGEIMSIVISGASGDLGSKITQLMLEKTDPSSLILLTRNPENCVAAAEAGAQVRQASFDDPETLATALAGGDIMLLISTLSIGKRVEQHKNAIVAAKAAGIKHIVYTSSIGIQPQTPSMSGKEHYATEEALKASGLTFTILRNSWYADVIPMLILKPSMMMGGIVASTGDGHVAPVAKADCARVAAGVLSDPERHENAIYEITGPDLLTFTDIAAVCSEVSGQTIPYKNVSHEEKLAIFDAMGASRDYEEGMQHENTGAWASNEMITYEMAIKQHYFAICSHHVQLITGEPSTPLSKVIKSYEAIWNS